MSKQSFEEFLKEYDKVTEGGLEYVKVNKEQKTITSTTHKLAYRSVHAPSYDIELTFYFDAMRANAVAEIDDEGDGWDSDERPFYGGDCGETEIEDAEDLAGAFEDPDWIQL